MIRQLQSGDRRTASRWSSISFIDENARDFIVTAAQIVPVLLVVLLADNFIRKRDAQDLRYRRFGSTVVVLGITGGLLAEISALHALARGPRNDTVAEVTAGMIFIGGCTILPRLGGAIIPEHAHTARRMMLRLLPGLLGYGGLSYLAFDSSTISDVAGWIIVVVGAMYAINTARAVYRESPSPAERSESTQLSAPMPRSDTSSSVVVEPTDHHRSSAIGWIAVGGLGVLAGVLANRSRRRESVGTQQIDA